MLTLASGVAVRRASAGPAPVTVSVFPIPGSRYNRPVTQIAFRGVPRGAIGRVVVVGSRTGAHRGRVEVDSDRDGASFVPARPFRAGETVTVRTGLNVLGGIRGRFSFAIGNVAPSIRCLRLGGIPRARPGDLQSFRSRPDLRPAAVSVIVDNAPAAEGDIFIGPQNGPVQNGPMILDPHGRLIWFLPSPVSQDRYANDLRVQDLHGQPVLTWWKGCRNNGIGLGEGSIVDRTYHQIATVRAADGMIEDSHELLLTPQGDAYITATSPVRLRVTRVPVIDFVVQEIDIKTGLVMFEWHALDHVPLSQSWVSKRTAGPFYDPYHVNSISLDPRGNLLLSMRNTSAVYLIDHRTGRVLWTLGGKQSSFKMGPGTGTWAQHDAVAQPDGTVTAFDNGGGLPFLHPQSRGIHERLDLHAMTATLIREYDHFPHLSAVVEGGMQLLPDGDAFVGWGAQRFFSEYDPAGRQILDGHFNDPIASYRAYRFNWSGRPRSKPAIATSARGHSGTMVYASWNGAADVASWRVLAGPSTRALAVAGDAPSRSFETAILVHRTVRYFAVQAVDRRGHILATSQAVVVGGHR